MYSQITLRNIIPIIFITIIGCDNSDNSGASNYEQPISVVTSNVNSGDIFLNLEIGNEVTPDNNWHLSIVTDSANYNMPSIVFGETNVAVYQNISFDALVEIPVDFSSMIVNNQTFEYGGANEILSYDITIHKVSVSDSDRVYVLSFDNGQNLFKLQFMEYQSGITVIQYNSLIND